MIYEYIQKLIDLCTPTMTPVPSNDSISFEDDAIDITELSNYDTISWLPEPQQWEQLHEAQNL